MKPEDVIELHEPKLNSFEAMFVPAILAGLGTTIRHFGRSIVGKHRTLQYPEERRENKSVFDGGMDIQRYRGVHRLNRDEQGRVKCVACYMCATACPAHCIHIVGEQSPCPTAKNIPSSSTSTNSAASTAACAKKPAPSTPSNSPASTTSSASPARK